MSETLRGSSSSASTWMKCRPRIAGMKHVRYNFPKCLRKLRGRRVAKRGHSAHTVGTPMALLVLIIMRDPQPRLIQFASKGRLHNPLTPMTMKRKRILFVDDDEDLLAAMKNILRQQGYEVAVATSCSEGLGMLETFHPDLILLDINIGSEDGRLMCRQIKEQSVYEHIPVILV